MKNKDLEEETFNVFKEENHEDMKKVEEDYFEELNNEGINIKEINVKVVKAKVKVYDDLAYGIKGNFNDDCKKRSIIYERK